MDSEDHQRGLGCQEQMVYTCPMNTRNIYHCYDNTTDCIIDDKDYCLSAYILESLIYDILHIPTWKCAL